MEKQQKLKLNLLKFLIFSNANRNRKFIHSKIEKSIIKLAKANVIKIDDVVKSDGRENTFIAKQIVDVKGQFTGFASINADEYFNIVLKINKDGEKIKALACYVSIIQRIFKTAKDELAKQAKFNISSLNYYINWESQENIGSKYGMGRKAVAKSIELLVEVEAIAIKEVRQKGKAKEIKNVYSKFADRDKLDMYVSEKLENGEYTKVNDKTVKSIEENTQQAKEAKEVIEETETQQVVEVVEVVEVAEDVATEQVKMVEKKEDKAKVININDDERIKRMQALASFENVKNVDEREEESKASVDLLAGHRPEKSAEA
jgi:biotin operon repressor